MERGRAERFAESWSRSWNAHDLEALLSHFADDVVFTSPLAARLLEGSDGVVHGKAALRAYWTEGLRRTPDLHFEVLGVYVGQSTVAINFRNQAGDLANEILTFEGDLVTCGHGTWLIASPGPAEAAPS